jgi:5-methyltetrahydropteroyltriglutamate--homocysteine methyltransferase
VAAAEDEVTTVVVAEQSRAFIDLVTDGLVRWEGPVAHLARALDGLEIRGGLRRWFHTNLYDRRVAVVGPVRRRAALLAHDYEVARSVTGKPVKVVLPGPVTVARRVRDEHYGSLERLAAALAQALAAEVAELAAAGARFFQLDEPLLCRHPEDLDLVRDTARAIFDAAGAGATTILSTYFGDLAAVGGRLGELPGTHLGLDFVHGEANWQLLERLGEGQGVALGLFDAGSSRADEPAALAARLEPWREALTRRDVLVGPNAGLETLPRDQAFDKLLQARYLVEALATGWTWA